MILPLLKNLRITLRSPISTTTVDRRDPDRTGTRSDDVLSASAGMGRTRPKSRSQSMLGMTFLGLACFATTATTSSVNAQSSSAYQPNSAAVAKQQYEAALRAQMLRAQVEQGAPEGFAEEAFAATQAYLEQTADKTYMPAETRQRIAGRTASRSVSSQPVSTYATRPRSMAPIQDRGYKSDATPMRTPTRYASKAPVQSPAMPPVHIAPTSGSTPPRANVVPQQVPVNRVSAPANLQDRIAGLLTRKRSAVQPTMAEPANEMDTRVVQSPTYTRAKSMAPAVQQPMFASEPRRIPTAQTAAQLSANRTTQAASDNRITQRELMVDQDEVAQVALNQPVAEPVLAAPGQSMMGGMSSGAVPQDHFATFQNQEGAPRPTRPQMSLPTTRSQPSFVGSQGSYPRGEEQVSVLSGGPVARGVSSRSEQTNPLRQELTLQEPDDNSFGGSLPIPDEKPANNRVRPLDPLQGRSQPQEGEGTDSIEERLRRIQDSDRDDSDLQKRINELSNPSELDRAGENQQEDDYNKVAQKTCDEFRTQLLSGSIRDIALDMSPPASRIRDQFVAISRSWTDQLGNIIVTGTMVDLRRGYVIIETASGLQKIPYAKLSDADWAAVSEYWQLPELCGLGGGPLPSRTWVPQTVAWNASALCHKPLYFENRQLERYGHSHGPILQPLHSTAHFFVSLATLPYQTAIHPPTECRYALGFYRPGNCAPWLKDPIPISLDGARRQALVATGLAFIP